MAQAPADCASVNVRKIEVRPNQCRVDDALYLKIEFDLAAPLSNAAWEVKVCARGTVFSFVCRCVHVR